MPNKFIEMSFDEWCETYKPITNHIDKHASFDNGNGGIMFETYGDEVDFVKEQDGAHIWTYGDGDDGGGYVWNGWHFVNRLGYFITEVPCPPDTDIQILVSLPCYFCEGCNTEWLDPDNVMRDKFQDNDLDGKCPKCANEEELALIDTLICKRCGEETPVDWYCESYDAFICRECCNCGCNA